MLALNDVIRIIMTWTWGTDSVAQLVWHYICTTAGTATYSAWLDAIHTNLQLAWANIAARTTDDLVGTLLEMLVWDYANNRWDGVASKAATGMDGTNVADYLPHGDAVLVKVLTAANRRQARKYVPGLVEGNVTAGFIDAAPLVDYLAFANQLDAILALAGGVIEFCTFNVDDTSPLFETASIARGSVVAEATGSYQRRRKPGVGLT